MQNTSLSVRVRVWNLRYVWLLDAVGVKRFGLSELKS